jgi:AraC-like DNA-binding protein
MAEQCHVSLRHLERRFKLEVGFTPRAWLKRQRLKTALIRLQGPASIKEIAYSLRYCQVSHFCRDFKLQFKMTPSESRRLPRAAQERLLALDNSTRAKPSSRESRSAFAAERKTTQRFSR